MTRNETTANLGPFKFKATGLSAGAAFALIALIGVLALFIAGIFIVILASNIRGILNGEQDIWLYIWTIIIALGLISGVAKGSSSS